MATLGDMKVSFTGLQELRRLSGIFCQCLDCRFHASKVRGSEEGLTGGSCLLKEIRIEKDGSCGNRIENEPPDYDSSVKIHIEETEPENLLETLHVRTSIESIHDICEELHHHERSWKEAKDRIKEAIKLEDRRLKLLKKGG